MVQPTSTKCAQVTSIVEPPGEPASRWPAGLVTRLILPLVLLGGVLAWACWPTLVALVEKWSTDPRYSHGFLVPVFAAYLLWYRRDRLAAVRWEPSWVGVALLAAGAGFRLAGVAFYVDWVRDAALLPLLAGIVMLVGGRAALAWSWPAIGFLVFMIPLPYRVEWGLGSPLQRIAVNASVYGLQLLGQPAVAEGNIIRLPGDVRVNVVEACNGLGMLMLFFAFTTAAALVVRRPIVDRVLIVLGTAPIAVGANVLRIVVTGWMFVMVSGQAAQAVYHDLAGWLMMPLALGTLWFELWVLDQLFVEPVASVPLGVEPIAPSPTRVSARGMGAR
jgi:exosortase